MYFQPKADKKLSVFVYVCPWQNRPSEPFAPLTKWAVKIDEVVWFDLLNLLFGFTAKG